MANPDITPEFAKSLRTEQATYEMLLTSGARLIDGNDDMPPNPEIYFPLMAYGVISQMGVERDYYDQSILEVAAKAIGNEPHAVMNNTTFEITLITE